MVDKVRGAFVVVDGPDGVGKTTVLRAIVDAIGEDGVTCATTREPSDGPIGKIARSFATGGSGALVPLAVQTVFLGDRFDHVASVIEPLLASGTTVVSDRYELSTFAFLAALEAKYACKVERCGFAADDLPPLDDRGDDGHRHLVYRRDIRLIEAAVAWHLLLPVPDITLVLSAPADVLAKRMAGREGAGAYDRDARLLRRSADLYGGELFTPAVVDRYRRRALIRIDADRPEGEVARDAVAEVRAHLRRREQAASTPASPSPSPTAARSTSPSSGTSVSGPSGAPWRNYIGVAGFMTSSEIEAFLAAAGPMPDHTLAAGVLLSNKTRLGLTNNYPARYPRREAIAALWHGDARLLNVIHYSTENVVTLREELIDVLSLVGPGCQGIQLNVPWPSVPDLRWLAAQGLPRRILQLGRVALASLTPAAVVEQLAPRAGFITDVLVDLSGGKGQPITPALVAPLLEAIRAAFPHLLIGVAGGLNAESLPRVAELPGAPNLSVDMESAIRSGGDADLLDIGRMGAAVKAAQRMWGFTAAAPTRAETRVEGRGR